MGRTGRNKWFLIYTTLIAIPVFRPQLTNLHIMLIDKQPARLETVTSAQSTAASRIVPRPLDFPYEPLLWLIKCSHEIGHIVWGRVANARMIPTNERTRNNNIGALHPSRESHPRFYSRGTRDRTDLVPVCHGKWIKRNDGWNLDMLASTVDKDPRP